MSAWIVIAIIVAVVDLAVIALFLCLAIRAPLVDDEPIVQQQEPRPECYVRLVPRDLFVLALAVLMASCAPAFAQQAQKPCGTHDDIMGQLDERYREEVHAFGLQSNGHLIQVYATATGATWTIVSTRQDGMACIVASGRWWQEMPRDVPIGVER